MRVIIVDDEITSSQVLEKLIQDYLPELEVMAVCNTANDAVLKLNTIPIDLVFMDIELPGMTGFDILEKIPTINFDIIFTTAHSQFGIRAIQFSAIDYLLKPINTDELVEAVQRVKKHKAQSVPFEKIKVLLENIQHYSNNSPFNRIAFPTNDGMKLIHASEIIHCTSSSNYTTIYLKDKTKLLVSKTLKDIENVLNSTHFCRIHNSHLVNTDFISRIIKGDIHSVVMTDDTVIEVSRRKKDELYKMLNL
jgi:two-component system LytT family response regulator